MADNNTRIFKVAKDAESGLMLTSTSAALVGDSRHFVVTNEQGTTIKGPISLVSDAMGIRRGGLFVGLNDFLNMIPSTMVTPIPNQIPFPPVFGLVNLARDVAFFTALLV